MERKERTAKTGGTERGKGQDGEQDGEEGEQEEEMPEGVSKEEFRSGPVPQVYRTATSQGGEERDPDELRTKESVNFGEAEDVEEAPEGQACSNCSEYIPDKNDDGFGACGKVEGYIGPEDWCSLWEELGESGS